MNIKVDANMKKDHITALDLFSGAGGFSEGLAQAGVKTLLAQELHPQPALTHVLNHPGVVGVVGDIRKLNPTLLKNLLLKHHSVQDVDLVVGGPPCQGFSTAGKKNEHDPRNTLFDNYCDIIAAFKPKVLVMENVPGFKKMYEGKMYEAARERLSNLGYDLSDRIINALDYGVPQRRRRFVMVGVRKDTGLKFVWPEPTNVNPEVAPNDLFSEGLNSFVSVEDALEDLAFLEPGFEANAHVVDPKSDYQKSRRSTRVIFNHLASLHRDKAVELFSRIAEGCTINSVPEGLKSAKKTMARLDRHHISNTVLALPDDLIHYRHNRIPTVREMARLQSFDDDYIFMGKRTSGFVDRKHDVPQYTQVGNAVPPLMAKAIGRAIVEMFGFVSEDIRDKCERAKRAMWVHGTSGFSGYTLSSEANADISLYDIEGSRLDLPIDDSEVKVVEKEEIYNWKHSGARSRKSQWAPGVQKSSSAAMRDKKKKLD